MSYNNNTPINLIRLRTLKIIWEVLLFLYCQ